MDKTKFGARASQKRRNVQDSNFKCKRFLIYRSFFVRVLFVYLLLFCWDPAGIMFKQFYVYCLSLHFTTPHIVIIWGQYSASPLPVRLTIIQINAIKFLKKHRPYFIGRSSMQMVIAIYIVVASLILKIASLILKNEEPKEYRLSAFNFTNSLICI